jgi:hypothetical protein
MQQSVPVWFIGYEIASPAASDIPSSRRARTFLYNTPAMTGYLNSPAIP